VRGGLRWFADRLFPPGANPHDTVPALLVLLTVVTGIVDAVSFLGLHGVFAANMTGNVVFLGFALAGEERPTVWGSLVALLSFTAGAWATGRTTRRATNPRRAFVLLTAAHALLAAAALVTAQLAGFREPPGQAALIALLACGMGIQSASVRELAVPDMNTNVLTTTLTALFAEGPGRASLRRAAGVAAMFLGALGGATLHVTTGPVPALAAATVLLALVAFAARSAR
ncbi:YoaK family protein, partial [Nonomuraea diastatica]|uniref:YoaK family protein n=1 Tax=Nonomuraea diastatica TaxID=1848329 RepID=UPI00140C1584